MSPVGGWDELMSMAFVCELAAPTESRNEGCATKFALRESTGCLIFVGVVVDIWATTATGAAT